MSMPEWLEKEMQECLPTFYSDPMDPMSRFDEGVKRGFQKCFELMQAQQTPRPIGLDTPKDEDIFLITKSSIFIGYYRDGYWWESASGDTCYGEASYCGPVQVYPTHWLPLPTLSEGSENASL